MIKILKKISIGLLVGMLIVVVFFFIRGQLLESQYYHIKTSSGRIVRAVVLADLHGKRFGANQEHLIKRVSAAEPDMIFYAGDMVERTKVDDSIESLLILTAELIRSAPIYYVDGNHELDLLGSDPEKYTLFNEKMKEQGAIHLDNEIVSIVLKDTPINICGLTTHYFWETEENALSERLRNMKGVNIMLCHYPESILWYEAFGSGGLDIAICGHTHGGLIRIPFKGGVYAPEWGYWPIYCQGMYPVYTDTNWYNYGGSAGSRQLGTMIISGGLAGEHHIPRINNPGEISVIDIE